MTNMLPLVVAYTLNCIDYIFTSHWVHKFGVDIELNPIGRWMFNHGVAWVFKIIFAGILFGILGICINRYPKIIWITYIPLTVYALIVVYHIVLAIKY